MLRVIDVVNWTNKIGGTLIVLKTYQRKRKKSQNKKRENRYKRYILETLNFQSKFLENSAKILGTSPNYGWIELNSGYEVVDWMHVVEMQ